MTIINPNSISGISSITALNSTAAINLFKADGTSANIIAGVVTASKFVGELSVGSSITFEDNEKAYFGNDGDMQLYHDGSKSVIANKTGYLQINATETEAAIFVNPNAAVRLSYDNDLKFETTASGAKVFNGASGGGILEVYSGDAGSAAGPELKLIRNSSSPADADYLGQIKFVGESDTSVERNYAKITGKILDASNGTEDGILEFAHIKAGSQTITGRWRSDSLQLLNGTNFSVAGTTTHNDHVSIAADNKQLKIGASSDFILYHDGTSTIMTNNMGGTSGNLVIQPKSGEDGIKVIPDGAVELYHDSLKKFETQTSGITVQGSVYALGTTPQLRLNSDTSDGSTTRAMFGMATSSNNFVNGSTANDVVLNCPKDFIISHGTTELMAIFKDDSSVQLYCDNTIRLQTTTNGIQVTGRADPAADSAHDLGTNGTRWRTAYLDTLNVSANGNNTNGTVANFRGGIYNQINIAHANNSSWGLLLTNTDQSTYGNNTGYHYSTNTGVNSPCAVVNVNSDTLHLATANTSRWFITHVGHFIPYANNGYDIGSSSNKVRDIYANGNLNINGNIVMASAASGRGIDFSASANASNASASMSSELFDDYEEGTFTPTDVSGHGITITNNNPAHYTKIGRFVHVTFDCTWAGGHSGGGNCQISLPFAMGEEYGSGSIGWNQVNKPLQVHVNSGGAAIMENYSNGSGSRHLSNNSASGNRIIGDCSYFTGT